MNDELRTVKGGACFARVWTLLLTIGVASGLAPTTATAQENMVIDLTYDSVMDMVRPEVHHNIQVHHNLHVTVAGHNALSENRNRNSGPYADRNAMMQVLGSTGDGSSYASWQVAPDGRLVRRQNDPQSTRTMIVTILPENRCHLDVSDQLKPGYGEYAFLRISTHTLGYFSTYAVTNTTCTIH